MVCDDLFCFFVLTVTPPHPCLFSSLAALTFFALHPFLLIPAQLSLCKRLSGLNLELYTDGKSLQKHEKHKNTSYEYPSPLTEALHISGNDFTVYDSVSATCCVSTPVHMYVTLDSSILWLPAQVHPIAAGNEPSHWCQTGQQATKKTAQIQDEAFSNCFDPHHLHLAVTAAPQVRLYRNPHAYIREAVPCGSRGAPINHTCKSYVILKVHWLSCHPHSQVVQYLFYPHVLSMVLPKI